MPLYDLACANGHIEEVYVPLREQLITTKCRVCGEDTERQYSITYQSGYSIFPYVTPHITGKPLEIKSQSHLREVEKRYNVRHRDDETWLTEHEKRSALPERPALSHDTLCRLAGRYGEKFLKQMGY